jgi:hypothetical protein
VTDAFPWPTCPATKEMCYRADTRCNAARGRPNDTTYIHVPTLLVARGFPLSLSPCPPPSRSTFCGMGTQQKQNVTNDTKKTRLMGMGERSLPQDSPWKTQVVHVTSAHRHTHAPCHTWSPGRRRREASPKTRAPSLKDSTSSGPFL